MKVLDFTKHKKEKDGVFTPDEILDGAKGDLDNVIIIGEGNDGDMFFSSNMVDKGRLLLLVEEFKLYLMLGKMDNEDDY